jgi:Tfp pilus assembly protein PilF
VLWSDSFERDVRDILTMQAEIAAAIARQVRAAVTPDEARSLAGTYSPSPRAHELYLLGRYHAYRKNPDSARRSVDYLVEATRLEPGFALAYASLAEAYRLREIWGGAGIASFAEESRQAAARALELDPALPEAHMAMAIYYSQREWNWAAADGEFARAIAGRPSLSDAHAEYSFHLQGLGRYEEGVAAAHRATLLDPLSPDHLSQDGRALFRARRYPEAIERFKKALELDPNFGSALSRLIDTYLVTGQYGEAEALLQKRRGALGEAPAQTAQLYARTGRLAEARALMARTQNAAGGSVGVAWALVHIALGQHDAALDSIERAVRARRLTAFSLRDPRFDPIASSPRFIQVLKEMNLPE